ncbi:acetyl-coenzyme A synthetase 2-like, mitochondrial isoform X2 [Convolutriloba macropyga]|uniref:acetyl-coenzyme A synthetase 2-like, mitochondrial isoform X2 n=1 Tax=Convolutriloba macropyga TaxID=536237 RepID=UPI003F5254AB
MKRSKLLLANLEAFYKFIGTSNIGNRRHQCNIIQARLFSRSLAAQEKLSLDRDTVYNRYEEVKQFARSDPESFWAQMAREKLKWRKDFTRVNECNLSKGEVSWFSDGQLNVSENCLDRHPREDIALIWEKDEPNQHEQVAYGELLDMTCQIAQTLLSLGVKPKDRVVIYLPTSPIAVATMLACARIGAMHCVVFAGFSASALAQRINDSGAKVVVTADKSPRGGKMIELQKIVTEALNQTATVEKVLLWQRTESKTLSGNLVDLMKESDRMPKYMEPEAFSAEDPLFMLYTSGSTGKPKGLVHTNGGYLTYTSWTHEVIFNCSKGDIYACVADVGWITGHSYLVYGPLANGVTSVLFESTPVYPDPGRYWEMVERLKINQFYAAPTAIRSLLKKGDSYPNKYDLKSLRVLGSVGEPINTEAWHWYNEVIGRSRCKIVDTWWQTETGGILISPQPSTPGSEVIPTMAMRPLPGIEPALIDPVTKEVIPKGRAADGDLCVTKPWPSMARTIWQDHERFKDTYITKEHGFYLTGDEAHQTEEGYFRITGRMDDVINISGHRLGTSEVEDAINLHPQVSESEINSFIKKDIASFAQPEAFYFVPVLPKTRSGKIMRRILKKLSVGITDDLGDVSTLAEPSAVENIVKLIEKRK